MLTKKDFQAAADLLKKELPSNQPVSREEVLELFCRFFRDCNPRFNKERFIAAATPSDNG